MKLINDQLYGIAQGVYWWSLDEEALSEEYVGVQLDRHRLGVLEPYRIILLPTARMRIYGRV
jgi:hypothetical protein